MIYDLVVVVGEAGDLSVRPVLAPARRRAICSLPAALLRIDDDATMIIRLLLSAWVRAEGSKSTISCRRPPTSARHNARR